MKRYKGIPFLAIILLISAHLAAQTTARSQMDWYSGQFIITASHPLESGLSPSDHPRALRELEMNLSPVILKEISGITWNRDGSLQDLIEDVPDKQKFVEQLAGSMKRNWSRLSSDFNSVEAEYSFNLFSAAEDLFSAQVFSEEMQIPIDWVPVPQDPWSGIVIYVPNGLPLRGTASTADPIPALKARILSESLRVLYDPDKRGSTSISYQYLDRSNEISAKTGRRPYRAMARALYGELPCDIILGEEDARRIIASESGRQALENGRIVILLDPLS